MAVPMLLPARAVGCPRVAPSRSARAALLAGTVLERGSRVPRQAHLRLCRAFYVARERFARPPDVGLGPGQIWQGEWNNNRHA